MKKVVIAAALALSAVSLRAQDAAKSEKFGAGVTLTEAVSLADLYASPAKFLGKTIRVDGTVTEVCSEMGCWMAIEQGKGLIVRIKVDDGGPIVFPLTAKGRKVSAEGVFEKVAADDKESQEANAFGKLYQIKGLGAIVY